MKNRIAAFIPVLVFAVAAIAAGNEAAAMWGRLYGRAVTLNHKYQIMLNIIDQDSRDMVPVLITALDEQVRNYENITTTDERRRVEDLILMILKELGRQRASDGADLVWETAGTVQNPVIRGEAIHTLGRIGAVQYARRLALMLRNINFNVDPRQDQRTNEIIAYALVVTLERMKDPEGYEPLFFASTGWYSPRSGVRSRAAAALPGVVEDPTDQLLNILKSNDSYEVKLSALQAAVASGASEERKNRVAVGALEEGLLKTFSNPVEARQLKALRLEALRILARSETKAQEAVPFMNRMLTDYRTDRRFDEDEILTLLDTFGTYRSDSAARGIAEFLQYLTRRRQAGSVESLRIAQTAVRATGNTRNPIGEPALFEITILEQWEASIRREARSALEEIRR